MVGTRPAPTRPPEWLPPGEGRGWGGKKARLQLSDLLYRLIFLLTWRMDYSF